MRIYIAAPHSKGDVAMNVRKAIEAADQLVSIGHTPYIPHLAHFWHLISPYKYEFWLQYDESFIYHWAEAVLRLPGESEGADREVALAKKIGLPVYYKENDKQEATPSL